MTGRIQMKRDEKMEISISAEVNCTDGSCGQISTIIVDPHKQEVTHLVVKDKSLPDSDQRLVPIKQVATISTPT